METEQKQLIKGDMIIGDLVQKYPDSVEVMLSYGLHCVGCHVNPFESIEAGAMAHGMDEKTINDLLKDLNNLAAKKQKEEPAEQKDIDLTPRAVEKLKDLIQKNSENGAGLRIDAAPGGCAGMHYLLDLKEKKEPEDKEFEIEGIKVFIPKDKLEQLQGIRIDYLDTLNESGFKISNPNASASCGCGKSFK